MKTFRALVLLLVLIAPGAIAQESSPPGSPGRIADAGVFTIVGGGGVALIALMIGATPAAALIWALAGAGTTSALMEARVIPSAGR